MVESKKIIRFSDMMKLLLKPDSILNFKSIERKNLPYFIGWIVVFIWLYSCFLLNGNALFLEENQISGYERLTTYVLLIVFISVTDFFKGTSYVPKTIYSVVVALICFLGIVLFKIYIAAPAFYVIIGVAMGHIFASCCYGFFMILNNTEKFYSMVLGILFPKILFLGTLNINEVLFGISVQELIFFCCILMMVVCSTFFMKGKKQVPYIEKEKFPLRAYSLMAVAFVVLTLNDVVAPLTILHMESMLSIAVKQFYFIGILFGLGVVVLFQKQFKLNICLMLNISFALLATGFVINLVVGTYQNLSIVISICFGIAYSIAMVNIYYFGGIMAKKFRNIVFYRIGITLSSMYYFYAFIIGYFFQYNQIFISIISVCIVITFFMISPIFIKLLYSGEWIDDSYRQDVTFESRLQIKFKELKLSPKEMEVCQLLLQGYTLRQTSEMMEVAYPTANTYYTSLYRKLKINSRAELLLFFREYENEI